MTLKPAILFALILLNLPACATFELEGEGAFTPDSQTGSETVHGSLYGIQWREFSTEKCIDSNLFRVETHTNAAFILASVVSLGLYVPQTIEWWCSARQVDAADEEEWDPTGDSLMELNNDHN